MNTRKLFDLTGRVAIVTGGSIGLGRQMAEGLAEMGAHLVLCARRAERCQQAADELRQLGIRTLALACDVTSPKDVQDLVEATLAEFGR
jgi:NAD(P)-dependent dehydrogenase (short-subunit alcohol dehydrogenase family)